MPFQLDDYDVRILKALLRDGRKSFRAISHETGITTPTVKARFNFSISDTYGRPITNLEPLMAAGGVVLLSVAISKSFCMCILSKSYNNLCGGPDLSFKTRFPRSGLYKAWGQFQHQGRVITTAGFILRVA